MDLYCRQAAAAATQQKPLPYRLYPCQPQQKQQRWRWWTRSFWPSRWPTSSAAGSSGIPISIPLPLLSHHPYPAGLSPLLKAANSASAGLSSLAAASAAITSQSIRASVTTTTTKIDLILPHNWFINNVSHIHGYYNNKNNIKWLLGVGRLRPFCWFFVFLRPFFNFSSLRLSPKKYVVLYILLFCLIVLFCFSFNLF